MSASNLRVWRIASLTTIALEVVLPLALFAEPTRPYAIAVGIALPTAFTCLKPRQLATFGGLNTGSYLLFAA